MIFAQYDSGGIDVDEFNTCFSVLDDRGPDGKDRCIDRNIAVGCQHFFVSPHQGTVPQPITEGGSIFAFDGRIDNRHELLRTHPAIDDVLTDVELFIALFKQHHVDAFDKIVGPFVALVYNTEQDRLICGRDTLGLRYAFYHHTGESVAVSSSPDALLAMKQVRTIPDRAAIAGYFSQDGNYSEFSFYDSIDTVSRGSYIVFESGTIDEQRYHTFTSRNEYTKARPRVFRHVLNKSVRARTSGVTQPAVALSGGRDSNTIASLLLHDFDSAPRTYSHVSRNGMGNDRVRTEMENIEQMAETHSLDSTRIDIDDYSFNYERCSEAYSFGLPILDPYLNMQIQLYQQASTDSTVLLDGFGGNCFDGTGFHYYDFLRQGQLYQLLERSYRDDGATVANITSSVLPLVANATARLSDTQEPAWLTAAPKRADVEMAVASLEKRLMLRFLLKDSKNLMRFQAYQAARKHGIDLRFPLMDERLPREVLKMPPGSLRTGGRAKGLFLDAVDGLLPPEIERFEVGMPFDPFLHQGLDNLGQETITACFNSLDTSRLGIVDGEMIPQTVTPSVNRVDGDIKPIHLWQVFTIEKWLSE